MSSGLLSRLVRACIVLVVLAPVVVIRRPARRRRPASRSPGPGRPPASCSRPRSPAPATAPGGSSSWRRPAGSASTSAAGSSPTPYLDIRSWVKDDGEGGLFSIAFHPQLEDQPVHLGQLRQQRRRHAGGAVQGGQLHVEHRQPQHRPIKTIDIWHPDQYTNHFGGQVAFGRDGYLYISTGDGGGGRVTPATGAQDMASLGSARSCACRSSGRTPPAAVPTASRRPTPTPGAPRPSGRSGRSACATRGGSRSTRPTATCGSATSASRAQEEVDRIPAGAGGKNLGWSCREGRLDLQRVAVPVRRRPTPRRRTSTAAATAPRSPAASSTAARRTRSILGGRYIGGDFGSGRIFYTTGSVDPHRWLAADGDELRRGRHPRDLGGHHRRRPLPDGRTGHLTRRGETGSRPARSAR